MLQLGVSSEIGQLRQVIIHRPDMAIARLTPSNCDNLLFDDILHLENAGKEHDVFQQVLRDNGVDVLLLHTLLSETLAIPEAKQWIIDRQFTTYRYGSVLQKELVTALNSMSCEQMASHLLGGMTVSELNSPLYSLTLYSLDKTDFIIEPIPNHIFTRDTSCWIYGGVSLNPMAKKARRRETIHLRAIYEFHPIFQKISF